MCRMCLFVQETASSALDGLHAVLAGHLFAVMDKAIDERMAQNEIENQVCAKYTHSIAKWDAPGLDSDSIAYDCSTPV